MSYAQDELLAASAMMRRTADLLRQEAERNVLSLTEADQSASVELAAAAAEACRASRELYGLLAGGQQGYDASQFVRDQHRRLLPLNRKERFYTGTVFPMIVASDAFAHLDRFLDLCGLPPSSSGSRRDGTTPCQLLTEYGFKESLFGSSDLRWGQVDRRRDTPDVILVGNNADWLVVVEAKMFDRPSTAQLSAQLEAQRLLVDEWVSVLGIPEQMVRHVLLIPDPLAQLVGPIDGATTVTWEQVAEAYRVVGPPYWVDVVELATSSWEALVARKSVGGNAEARLTGQQIVELYAAGLLTYGWMGRQGGFSGAGLLEDLESDRWRGRIYEVRTEPLDDNPNWFGIAEFVAMIEP